MAAAQPADEHNYRIAESFNRHCYNTWEDYVLQCQSNGQSMESQKTQALALLSLLCYKFTRDGRNYEKLLFDLLCQALEPDSDATYRTKQPKKVRVTLFKHPPANSVKRLYSFVWPMAFTACDNNGQEIKETFFIGIPSQYFHSSEETGMLCTVLYLVMSDTVGSFRKSLLGTNWTQVDCPCLLDFFRRSSLSDRDNLPTLIGEYLAFLNACHHLEFHGTSRFEKVDQSDDFEVSNGAGKRKFSVKTDSLKLRFFVREHSKRSNQPLKLHPNKHDTIVIQSCDCDSCKLNPTVELSEARPGSDICPRANATGVIIKLFGSTDTGTHYVTSVGNYFDLEFAMSDSFDHDEFRSGDGQQQVERFRSKREFVACFEKMATDDLASLGDGCLVFRSS